MQEEIWKDIKGYEGFYQVSNLGRVKSLERFVNGKFAGNKSFKKSVMLKQCYYGQFYYNVQLNINGHHKTIAVHRLVAKAFIPNPENKKQVNHIDGNKLNNNVKNLEWATSKENINHAYQIGLSKSEGTNHYLSKLNKEDVLFIRNSDLPNRELSNKYGVSMSCVQRIKRRERYKNI